MAVLIERISLSRLIPLVVLLTLPLATNAAADMWDSVFIYQQKMANYGQPKAQLKLGEMYEEGHGTEQNFDEAEKWYQKALKQGFVPAQEKLDKLQQRRQQQAADIVKARQEQERQVSLERDKTESERLAREAEQELNNRRTQKRQADKEMAVEKERVGRARAEEAIKKMMAVPEAFD